MEKRVSMCLYNTTVATGIIGRAHQKHASLRIPIVRRPSSNTNYDDM